MQRTARLSCLLLLGACAHTGSGPSEERQRLMQWDAAHHALAAAEFVHADSLFSALVRDHEATQEGRESRFYLGTLYLDPRNPAWDPAPAEAHLRGYLAADSVPATRVHRRPEAQTLLELAQQLNLPAEDRVPGLNPGTRVVVRDPVVTRASDQRAIAAEAARLRAQVAERDGTIRELREELERIRRTLTGQRR